MANPRVMAHPDAPVPRPPRAGKALRKPVKAATAGEVTVNVDPILGAQGTALAATVASQIAAVYHDVLGYFGLTTGPQATCQIAQLSPNSDGTGGAYHTSCEDTTCVVDADFDQPERTLALFVAEFSECLQAQVNLGWSCGDTNGEGLSRFHAELLFSGALDDYSSASSWLDTPDRPDWINHQQGSDTDYPSVGCGVLFLFWLQSRGHSPEQITAAGGPNLGATWSALGEQGDAYQAFRQACDSAWPVGTDSGVTSDNPWPSIPAPEPTPGPTPEPTPGPTPGGGGAVSGSLSGTFTGTFTPDQPTPTPAPAGSGTAPAAFKFPGGILTILAILSALANAVGGILGQPAPGSTAREQQKHREKRKGVDDALQQLQQLQAEVKAQGGEQTAAAMAGEKRPGDLPPGPSGGRRA